MDIPKVHSITKKIMVALLGGFLMLFLLFHATANLFILRHDDGAWYTAFCHFMGTNWIVKVFEVVLLGAIALHMLLTLWLALTNRAARPVRYHHRQESKTHTTSKWMVWTGILIFACLIFHFCDFYFVKLGWVKGEYMVKVEKLQEEEGMRDKVAVMDIVQRAVEEDNLSADRQWIRHLTYDERQVLRREVPESKPEPDFYYMARSKFQSLYIVVMYLLFFAVVFMHMRHAFPAAFQTLGLNNYKYNNIIETVGKIYTWVVTMMFSAVPILVYLGI